MDIEFIYDPNVVKSYINFIYYNTQCIVNDFVFF